MGRGRFLLRSVAWVLVGGFVAMGCGRDPELNARPESSSTYGVAAVCEADVEGLAPIDVEGDYLPHVITCENGAADFEALRAQAVAARSYLYYKVDAYPGVPIEDGTGDQVYSCGNEPGPLQYEAVASTAGEILRYEGTYVAGFYVAGAVPSDRDSCVAAIGDDDYSGTEHFVTYNPNAAGDGLEQTSLGWVAPANWANRGCKSQNGAHCLAEAGWGYEDILRFYYGADIDLHVASGSCVLPDTSADTCGAPVVPEAVHVVDDADPCFFWGCVDDAALVTIDDGVDGSALETPAVVGPGANCFGRWRLSFEVAGSYRVSVHIPDDVGLASSRQFFVQHGGLLEEVVDESGQTGWFELGTFWFDAGRHQYVERRDTADIEGSAESGPFVRFDAIEVAAATDGDGGVVDEPEPSPDDAGESDAAAPSEPEPEPEPENPGGEPEPDPGFVLPYPADAGAGADAGADELGGCTCVQPTGPRALSALPLGLALGLAVGRRRRRGTRRSGPI